MGEAILAADRVLGRRPARTVARRHAYPHGRAFPRLHGAALEEGPAPGWHTVCRRYAPGGVRPAARDLHVQLPELYDDETLRCTRHARAPGRLRVRGRLRVHVGAEHHRWRTRRRGCFVRSVPGGYG